MVDFVLNALGPYTAWLLIGAGVLALLGLIASVLKRGFAATGETLGWVWAIALFCYPAIIYICARAVPELREVTTTLSPFAVPDHVLKAFLAFGIVGVAFVVTEAMLAQFAARVVYLVTNLGASMFWAVSFSYMLGKQQALGDLNYFELLSASIAIFSVVVGVFAYVVGAWNKNPTQVAGGRSSIG